MFELPPPSHVAIHVYNLDGEVTRVPLWASRSFVEVNANPPISGYGYRFVVADPQVGYNELTLRKNGAVWEVVDGSGTGSQVVGDGLGVGALFVTGDGKLVNVVAEGVLPYDVRYNGWFATWGFGVGVLSHIVFVWTIVASSPFRAVRYAFRDGEGGV